ncbi:MAG TPA: hypothetical protein VFP72_16370 [Kineosporiaceae bacterium]|nr:hypothetical protein [Kineosporiaceae bacterium]
MTALAAIEPGEADAMLQRPKRPDYDRIRRETAEAVRAELEAIPDPVDRIVAAGKIMDDSTVAARRPRRARNEAALSLSFYDRERGVSTLAGFRSRTPFYKLRCEALELEPYQLSKMTPEGIEQKAKKRNVKQIPWWKAIRDVVKHGERAAHLQQRIDTASEIRNALIREVVEKGMISQVELSRRLGVLEGRISQIVHDTK